MSVTVTLTAWDPTAKTCGLEMTVAPSLYTMVSTAQLSAGVAAKLTLAEQRPASLLTAILAGALTTGASLSVTVTVKLVVAVFPAASVTVAVTVVTPVLNTLPLGGVVVTPTAPS